MLDFFMAAKRRTTIFRQLILNVMLPPIIALLVLGALNFSHTKDILIESNNKRNYIIGDEIINILEFNDIALDIIEKNLNKRISKLSFEIRDYLATVPNPEKIDLNEVRKKFGMNPDMEDIYIINKNGIVVNTTFEKDLNLNFFSFGEEHKNMILKIFKEKEFHSERFAIEAQTRRIKKFSYHPTIDGNYIIQIGVYSTEADSVVDFIKSVVTKLAKKNESVESVDLFIIADEPFSFEGVVIDDYQKHLINSAFINKDTITVDTMVNNQRLTYQYIYMDRKKTELYKGSVIRIITDQTADYDYLKSELIRFVLIFVITLLLVVVLIYFKTKIITDPIKKLVFKVNRITHGHLHERADEIGNNEITTLSKQFNRMIEELESYYYELEQKVKDRTREIEQQKEEIASQRDSIQEQRNMLAERNDSLQDAYKKIQAQKKHITDSIIYAQRIQNAILPAQFLIDKIIPNNFILYKPKDIVSGDFYWVEKMNGKSVIAAVDCTGHGVPGAFMSIIGTNQLNSTVHSGKVKNAGEILDALSIGVEEALQQKNHKSVVKDGMDIALCVIDYENMILEFAGAYNPLYLLRNGEMQIIKADKFPIGSFSEYQDRHYTNHIVELKKDDVIYIFSDGYADQFGGEKGRKYMYKRFREYLLTISSEPLEKQKMLLDEENERWKGSETQVDDIIVIGIKI